MLGEWFGNNDPHGVAAALPEFVKALQTGNPSIKSWGIIGVSWSTFQTRLLSRNPTDRKICSTAGVAR